MNRERLLYWAFNRGKQGHPKLYDNSALDIGTCVHTMAELDLKGEPEKDIEFYLNATLADPDDREKAQASFKAFRAWRSQFHADPYRQELSLVSEKLQYGGTLDTIAFIRGGKGLLEFKTSSEVYEDHLMQMAAYGILWAENFPDEPLDGGYHLILLPKDGAKPVHREFTHEQLNPFRQKFWLYRKAYDFEAVCNDPKVLAGSAVAPSPPTKRKAKIIAPPAPLTMGELLRAYGHIGVTVTPMSNGTLIEPNYEAAKAPKNEVAPDLPVQHTDPNWVDLYGYMQ
jgi:hypothetical protein